MQATRKLFSRGFGGCIIKMFAHGSKRSRFFVKNEQNTNSVAIKTRLLKTAAQQTLVNLNDFIPGKSQSGATDFIGISTWVDHDSRMTNTVIKGLVRVTVYP